MAWLIEDDDASIYVLGTIHYGIAGSPAFDDDCAKAFEQADTLIAELSSEDYARTASEAAKLVRTSALPASKTIEGSLSAACKSAAIDLLGEDAFKILVRYRPWVLSVAMLDAVIVRSGMDPSAGVDGRLYKLAGERAVEGLDTLRSQFALLTEGSDEEQIASLEASVPKLIDGSFIAETQALAAAYASDDREETARLLAASIAEGISANPADAASYEKLLQDRNKAWARRLADKLAAGGKYFVFAGAAHFLGDGSVFDEMRALGAIQ